MDNGFQGREGEKVPYMSPEFVMQISERYIELYEKITGMKFKKANAGDPLRRIEENVGRFLTEAQ